MSTYYRRGAVALIAATLAAGAAAAAQPAPAEIARAEKIVAAEAAEHRQGSLTVGFVSGSHVIWTRSYGYADETAKTPATRHTVYRIGSVTKQFTGVMLLQLVEHRKVSLSDPVEKYFPAIKTLEGWPPPRPITLLDLATHRAGLAREPHGCIGWGAVQQCRDVIGPVSEWEQTLTAALPRVTLERAPEVSFSYSNVGYAILGAAMSHAVGEPYTRYVSENIFAPLDMTHTAFEPTAQMSAVLARGYVVEKGVADPSIPDAELKSGRGYKVPNGAIFTTIDDLAKFVSFEMGEGPESVLPHDVLKANYQRAFPISDRGNADSYGVGFSKQLVRGHVIIGHDGAVAGYTAGAFFDPDSKIGVVCLTSYTVPCGPAAIKALVALLGG